MIGGTGILDLVKLSITAVPLPVALGPDAVLVENRYQTIVIRMDDPMPPEKLDLRLGLDEDAADDEEREESSCDICAPRERGRLIGDHGEGYDPVVCPADREQCRLIAARVARLGGRVVGAVETFQRIIHRGGSLCLEKGFCCREPGHLSSVYCSWFQVPVAQIAHH